MWNGGVPTAGTPPLIINSEPASHRRDETHTP